jgi:hypothetical protein
LTLEDAGVKLDVRRVESLLPHEDTIPSHVERVTAELKHDGVQKDPIIVDSASGTVLDGMHRLAAFQKLGIGNAVCAAIDYGSESVGLDRWARVYSHADGNKAKTALAKVGLTLLTTFADAIRILDGRENGPAVFVDGDALLPGLTMDLQGAFGMVRELDSLAQERGWRRRFVPEDELEGAFRTSGTIAALVQRLGKDDVVAAAKSNHPFPCKTSLHSVDPRPVAVNFPLKELDGASAADLRERFAQSVGELLPPNSTYGGRRYKERLLLLTKH